MAKQANFAHELEQIGLTEKESAVYLALLSIGTGTAYQIAEHCEVKKPTVYVILEDLRKKGLVLKVPHAKKALFAPRDIIEYLSEQESRLKSVRAIVPQLHSLGGQGANVFFFSGMRGVSQAIEYKLEAQRGKKILGFYSNLADAPPEMHKLYSAWDRRCLDMDISFDILMAKRGAGKYHKDIFNLSKKNPAIRIKLLEKFDYPENQTIDMGGDFLRIVDEKRLHATIIDDKQTAEAMRQIFQIVWEKGV